MIDYSQDIENVKDYYADLLILQYHSKQRAKETIKMGAEMYLGDGVVFQLQDILDIDTAEGAQLDLIGKILDCPRIIPGFEIDKPFFTFEHTGDDYGFSTVGQPSQGYFKSLSYDYSSMYSLPDNDYRTLLKFKAIANRARASWAGIDEIFNSVFGDSITITNNKNLTITYNILQSAVTDGLLAAIKLNYLEPPLGIGYNINYLQYNENAFTKIGTPTITSDGVAISLNSYNYLQVPINIMTGNKFEISFHFKVLDNAVNGFLIGDITSARALAPYIYYYADTNKLQLGFSTNGENLTNYYTSNLTIQKNKDYIAKITSEKGVGTSLVLYHDNVSEMFINSQGSERIYSIKDLSIGTGMSGGGALQSTTSSFDLKQFSIKIDGAIALSGKQIY